MPKQKKTVIAYKGFNADWKCRGFQYEVGKTYTHKGEVETCLSGFHACESPFDVWSYYGPFESKFALVEMSKNISSGGKDTKVAAAQIAITAELKMPDFIKAGVKWLVDKTAGEQEKGNYANIGSSGDYANIGSSGKSANIGSSGNSAKIGSSGDYAKIGSSGKSANIGSSGKSANIGSSGDYANIGSSGDYANIGSSGDYAKIGSSGKSANIGSSGKSANIGSSGDYANIENVGRSAVVASSGPQTFFKGKNGDWVSLAEYKDGVCVGFSSGCVGHDGVKADTWYEAKDGKLTEVA